MNDEFFLNGLADGKAETGRQELADEIRISLWPHVTSVRRLIGGWVAEHQSPIDLLPLPSRRLTLAEKCASLAAFHDSVDEGEPFWTFPEIPPPNDDQSSQSEFFQACLNEMPWVVLLNQARKIIPRPNDPLRVVLRDVIHSLMAQTCGDRSHTSLPPHAHDKSFKEIAAETSIATSELKRIADQLRSLSDFSKPMIGLFSWTQELTGFAGERHRTISHADTAGALGGTPQNILWFGGETWRQPKPLQDENGNAIMTPLVGPDGKTAMLHGQSLVVAQQSPIEYRGIVAVDINHSADLRFLSSGLTTGVSGGVKIDLLRHLHAAGEVLAKSRAAITALWDANVPPPYPTIGAGPLVVWFSAMLTLHERGTLIGDLMKPFWHWNAHGPRLCEFAKPGTDCTDIDPSRNVAVIADPVRASLQMIDWIFGLESHNRAQSMRTGSGGKGVTLQVKSIESSVKQTAESQDDALTILRDVIRPQFDELSRRYAEYPVSVTLIHRAASVSTEKALALCPHRPMKKPDVFKSGTPFWVPSTGVYGPVHSDPSLNDVRLFYFNPKSDAAYTAFASIADEAALCLGKWAISIGVSGDTIAASPALFRWVYALFDLAWTRHPRFPVDTKRNYLQNIEIYHQLIRLQTLGETGSEEVQAGILALQQQGYFAHIKDVLRASVYAIDVLTEKSRDTDTNPDDKTGASDTVRRLVWGAIDQSVDNKPIARESPLAELTPNVRKAYFSYRLAESIEGKPLEDRQAYDRIREHGCQNEAAEFGELDDYELPTFDTWARYLRKARRSFGMQKYSRRPERALGRSIVRRRDI